MIDAVVDKKGGVDKRFLFDTRFGVVDFRVEVVIAVEVVVVSLSIVPVDVEAIIIIIL